MVNNSGVVVQAPGGQPAVWWKGQPTYSLYQDYYNGMSNTGVNTTIDLRGENLANPQGDGPRLTNAGADYISRLQ